MIKELYHVSENPNIKEFTPLPPPNKDAGVIGNAVWAISSYELTNYLFPRDCPRICYRNKKNEKIIAIEEAWLDQLKKATIHVYTFNPAGFILIDKIAGYWISRNTVKPQSITKYDNLLGALAEKKVKLKILTHLNDEKKYVVDNYDHFSIIRFKNASKP